MKSKAILRSVAVMMSLLTVLPCFGNAAFAMDCNEKKEGQPLAQRRADSTEKVKKKNLETVRIFNQLAESLTKGEITDKKVNSFLNRMENDPLVKPYLNYVDEKFISQEFSKNKMTAIISPYVDVVDEEFKENIRVNHLENNRISLYMFYFPFYLLDRITGEKKQRERIRKSIKKMVYNVSRLPDIDFSNLPIETYTGVTCSDFLRDYFTENAKKCFTNSDPEYVYRYSINNKCNIVFVKKGNEIVFLNSLGHIYNGKQ